MPRDYASLRPQIDTEGSRDSRMKTLVDVVWESLADSGISWVGFYAHEAGDELVLSVCRDKPACSPIGMHGACGQVFRSGKPLVVRDVKELGENYVACDPRDQSEVVIPCISGGKTWGVLDLDSFDIGAFDESDVEGLTQLLRQARLTD